MQTHYLYSTLCSTQESPSERPAVEAKSRRPSEWWFILTSPLLMPAIIEKILVPNLTAKTSVHAPATSSTTLLHLKSKFLTRVIVAPAFHPSSSSLGLFSHTKKVCSTYRAAMEVWPVISSTPGFLQNVKYYCEFTVIQILARATLGNTGSQPVLTCASFGGNSRIGKIPILILQNSSIRMQDKMTEDRPWRCWRRRKQRLTVMGATRVGLRGNDVR